MIVPGRGRLADETDVANYRDMVTIVRDRVRDWSKKGAIARRGEAREADVRLRRYLRRPRSGPAIGSWKRCIAT